MSCSPLQPVIPLSLDADPQMCADTMCVDVIGESSIMAYMTGKEDKRFTFDKVLPPTATQLELFEGE